jgi:hypothetical protein
MLPRTLTIAAIALAAVLAGTAAIAVAPDRNNPKSSTLLHRAVPSALR